MTSLNLRKALKIKKQLESLLAKPVSASLSIDLDDPQTANIHGYLAKAEEKYLENVENHIRLSSILFHVRRQIEDRNSRGINLILSQVAHIDRQIAILKKIIDMKPLEADVLSAKIERKREQAKTRQSAYGYDDDGTIDVAPVSLGTIATSKARIADLRKQKEALEDKRLALNSNAEFGIEIADADIEFLAGFDIV